MLNQYSHIPREAFLFFPKEEFCKEGAAQNTVRWIFSNVQLDPFEENNLNVLKSQIAAQRILLSPYWTDSHLLRFLQANKFITKKAIQSIREHESWVCKNLPIKLTQGIMKFLKSGAVYFHGRDFCFRPLLVINMEKCQAGELGQEELIQATAYFLQFIISEVLVQGQVENWFVILDLKGVSLWKMAGLAHTLITFLANTYRCRMVSTFLLNCPGGVGFLWDQVRKVLDERTAKKINLNSAGIEPRLFEYFHPSQVEQKYGGTAPDLKEGMFIPVKDRSSEFCPPKRNPPKLATPSEYYRLFLEKRLHLKVSKQLVEEGCQNAGAKQSQENAQDNEFTSTELRETTDFKTRLSSRTMRLKVGTSSQLERVRGLSVLDHQEFEWWRIRSICSQPALP